jgi:cytochrome c
MTISCNSSQEASDSVPPEENRFTTTVITQPGQLDEPMVFTFTSNDQLLFVERKGALKSFNLETKQLKTLAMIPVNTKYTSKEGEVREAEEGLMGIIAHPDFQKNRWIYMFYADPEEKKHVLARWEVHGDSLYASSKKVVLEIPTQREVCCHTGGGMEFDKEGSLYLTTGNNSGNPTQGTSALDERPERSSWDDQRTAGNTNDLRGKILRIHPEDDGTYTIPKGNLFAEGTAKTRPEIYTMGHRNPWRISVDSHTGFIYWGEVGPDASKDSIIGPRGYDEFNQARKPGFFGWPYFVADNKPYADYDYATNAIGEKFDTARIVNNSPNNTGLTELPAAQKAFIWYPYANSEEFPLVGSAGRSATGGPIFRKADFEKSEKRFPPYFEGKWMIVEFMRGWIMVVSMDEEGNYKSMERFLPNENFSSAIDMKFSPDGDLYVLEYGSAWFRGNENAQIKKIEFNGGNRKPTVKASADRLAGALPLTVKLSSQGTLDYDKDELKYEWTVKSDNGFSKTFTEANPEVTLDKQGVYTANLTVTDAHQEKNSRSFELRAGNEPPLVNINIEKGNKTFFFPNSEIAYSVDVTDKEDGSLKQGQIKENEVAINFDYAPEGFDPIEIAQNHRSSDEWTSFSKGGNLISKSDCKSCHMIDKKSVGPSYQDVAAKYKNNIVDQERIAKKIITGGSGVWGDHAMSAHPQLSEQDAASMVSYIMSLTDQKITKAIPATGTFAEKVPDGDNGRGSYLLRVAYKDKGTPALGSLSAEKIIALRNSFVDPEKADEMKGTQLMTTPSRSFNIVGNNAHLGFKNIDLTGIRQIGFLVQAPPRIGATGGVVEVHLDSPDGKLIGKTEHISPKNIDFRAAMAKLAPAPKPNDKKKRGQQAQAPPPVDMNAMRRMILIKANAPLEPVEGSHNVYFVFKNENAKSGQILVQVAEINFQNQAQPIK